MPSTTSDWIGPTVITAADLRRATCESESWRHQYLAARTENAALRDEVERLKGEVANCQPTGNSAQINSSSDAQPAPAPPVREGTMSPRDIEVAIEAVVPLAARCKVEIEWRDKELAALRSRVEEGERDTARIDYLQKSNIRWGRDYWASFVSNFPDLRSGIDAAMAATPEPKENARG